MALALSLLTLLFTDLHSNYYWEIFNILGKCIIKLALFLLSCLLIPILRLRGLKKKKTCPPIQNNILYLSATKLAEKIRKRELSCEQVVRAYIERCNQVNPTINAIVDDRFEEALSEAREIDAFLKCCTKSEERLECETPLLGVPITVKESVGVKGLSHAVGRKSKDPIIALNDGDVVKRAKKAGAIPLLVSNTPEMCMCWETFNNVTGITWNPYDTNRSAGGSSGGEAALLGSAASVLSISSDIGGSVRLPALFCGVFGHKPTPAWVSWEGHMPGCTDPEWPSFFTIGPMARYSEDLAMILKVLSQSNEAVSRLNEKVDLKSLKYFYIEDDCSYLTANIDKEIVNGMQKFSEYLENAQGVNVHKIEVPELRYAFEASVSMLLRLDGVQTIFTEGNKKFGWKPVLTELLDYISLRSSHTLPNIVYGILKKIGDALPANHYRWMAEKNNLIKERLQDLLGDDGVLIFPSFPTAAHYPYEIYHTVCNVTYMMIFNSVGFPVTQCPIGLNSKGLPIGFQIVGNVGRDNLTIAVAREVEKAFGGWQQPPHSQ